MSKLIMRSFQVTGTGTELYGSGMVQVIKTGPMQDYAQSYICTAFPLFCCVCCVFAVWFNVHRAVKNSFPF